MGKKDQEQGIDHFLKSEFLDLEKNKIPAGFSTVEKYPLKPPFSYAIILQENETGRFLYLVDEVKMNAEEQAIYEKLYALIEQSLESPDSMNKQERFSSYLAEIIKENQKIFDAYPLAGMEKVKYYLERDIAGFGPIDALMHDLNIEDISCSGINAPIYIWHRTYDSLPTNIKFEDEKLNSFVSRIVFRAGKHISSAFPISDLALEGNHRISVLYQKEVTPKGTSFTIRKFREDPYTIVDLISFGTINTDIAAYLWMLTESKMSVLVIGSTGSGKTTILNAIIGLVNPDYKIFSVEDVAEINIDHENWFSLISRTGFGSGGEGEIGLYDLIKSGVRHRPDYIVVGEIRGSEAYVMFQAMATGHGGLCTMHADSLESASKRLQQKPMDIPPAYLSLMNCAIVIRRVKEKETGQSSRKAVSIQEIKSAESFNTVFGWNVKTNDFDGEIKTSIMLQRIAQQTGISMDGVLSEYERRKKVLKWLTDNGIRSYKQVAEVIGKYYRDPEALMQKIE
jgi:flagellar protein FlaI